MADARDIRTLRERAYSSLIFNSFFNINDIHPAIKEKVIREFLEAIIDDDREIVAVLLDNHPELLMIEPMTYDRKDKFVIESKLTWQKFIAENGVILAAKRKQFEMLKLMLPFYDKLEQTEAVKKARVEAISACSFYEKCKNAQGQDEIVIPQEYANYAKSLIDVFSEEPCSNLDATGKVDPTKLSEKTESELSSLLNILVPKHAVKLDDYFDVELFLLTVYKAYLGQKVLNENQKEAFCIRVIGLIQSALTPETAKIFCHSLWRVLDMAKEGKNIGIDEIDEHAVFHKLSGGQSFYRKSRDDFSEGVGSGFYMGMLGELKRRGSPAGVSEVWSTYIRQKTANLVHFLYSYAHKRKRAAV